MAYRQQQRRSVMMEKQDPPWQEITLRNDDGAAIRFQGRLFSENSFFDEEQGMITRLKLFATQDGRMVYSVVTGSSTAKSRRVYSLHLEGDLCHIDNGTQNITLQRTVLLDTVFGLCGIGDEQAEPLRHSVEESLNAANG